VDVVLAELAGAVLLELAGVCAEGLGLVELGCGDAVGAGAVTPYHHVGGVEDYVAEEDLLAETEMEDGQF